MLANSDSLPDYLMTLHASASSFGYTTARLVSHAVISGQQAQSQLGIMGNLCSKSSSLSGGHTVLGSGPQTLGGGPVGSPSTRPSDPDTERLRRAEAAARRLEEAGNRGVNQNNPNHGRLAKALAKKPSDDYGPTPTDRQRDKDLVWD